MPDWHGPFLPVTRWIDAVNGGVAGAGAAVVGADELGVADPFPLPMGDEETAVDPDAVGLTIPAGVRAGDRVALSNVFVHAAVTDGLEGAEYTREEPGTLIPGSEWIPGSQWIPGSEWTTQARNDGSNPAAFPGEMWTPDDDRYPAGTNASESAQSWYPSTRWIPGSKWIPDDPSSMQVLIPSDASFRERLDIGELPPGAQRVEAGQPVGREVDTLVVAQPLADVDTSPFLESIEARYVEGEGPGLAGEPLSMGGPAPTGGAGFGFGVLATPSAGVAGQEANPIFDEATVDLLQRDRARAMLRRAGVTDADDVEWLEGPTPADGAGAHAPGTETTVIVDSESELESFTGVVSGTDGAWGVGVHVVRASPDDHLVAAGVQRRPVGLGADGGYAPAEELFSAEPFGRARRLTAATTASLERRDA